MHDRRYRSFVVRVWMSDGAPATARVEIERIQSGTKAVLHGVAAEHVVAVIDPAAGDGRVPGPSSATVVDVPPEGSAT